VESIVPETTTGFWGLLFLGFVWLAAGLALGWTMASGKARHLNGTNERISTENAHCARSGGRLVRGQAREFICIDPGGVKWTRAR